jgi:hypothetical protein
MTITYGFYDSISEDRLYNAKQMGSIFDGLVLDGVYGGYLDKLTVIEDTGMDVSVGAGRAWFDHTWTYNDAAIPITVPTADALLNRIDVIYLEVNENVGVRANSIDILEGTPATDPVVPELTNTSSIHQYALAHIYVGAAVTEIVQANITDMVGTEDTPYVTILVESEDLQAQIWAIVGDIYPPLLTIIELEAHNHDGNHTTKIPAGSLAADAVEAGNIADDGVVAGNLANGAVNAAAILGSNVVETAKIKNLNVTSDKLAADAVIAGKIANYAVDTTPCLANDIVDDTKVGNRVAQIFRRQGGHASNWSNPGATTYTPTMVRIQTGVIEWTGSSSPVGSKAITFPVSFSFSPNVVVSADATPGVDTAYAFTYLLTSGGVTIGWKCDSNRTSVVLHWIAIGPE